MGKPPDCAQLLGDLGERLKGVLVGRAQLPTLDGEVKQMDVGAMGDLEGPERGQRMTIGTIDWVPIGIMDGGPGREQLYYLLACIMAQAKDCGGEQGSMNNW